MIWQDGRIALIRPMLEITRSLTSLGMVFRYGLTRLSRGDFARIARAMLAYAAAARPEA